MIRINSRDCHYRLSNDGIEKERNYFDSKKYYIVGNSAFALKPWLLVPDGSNGLTLL